MARTGEILLQGYGTSLSSGRNSGGAELRTVEAFQAIVVGLGAELDTWLLAHERSLPQASRHAVEDARLSLSRAHRDLSRVKGHQRRR